MSNIQQLLTEHLDIWTSADSQKKSGRGRASGKAGQIYGIQKLRELILELAVRGKLVPQNQNDEPASELLKRIQAKKATLIAEGKFKKEKPLAPISEDEKPFELPRGWEWVRLREISEANTGYAFKSSEYKTEGTFVLRVTNINPDSSINPDDAKFISAESAKSEYKSFQLSEGDVLLVMVGGSLGKIGVVDKACLPAVLNQNMWKLSYVSMLEKEYFIHGLRFINNNQIVITESTHGHLAQGEYLSKLFPLAPVSEQRRIVVKIDELMALCDQLENQQSHATEAHEQLVSQLLGTLTQVQNAQAFQENWQRIAQHFETLFTTESSIDALKQTLLQLAVMGKLVPQNHDDEPASELLKRIQTEKAKLIAEGKLKKEKSLAPISEDEKPFELPRGWKWVRLAEIIKISSGDGLIAANMVHEGGIPVFGGNGINGYHNQANVDKKTLVIGRVGYYCGSIHVTPENAWVTDNAFITNFSEANFNLEFLYWLLRVTNLKENDSATAQPVISGAKVYPIVVAIPPLAEQHRIVAKVDELMALCDQLKTRIQQANQHQQLIADALVAGILD